MGFTGRPGVVKTVAAFLNPDLIGELWKADPAPPLPIGSRVALGVEATPSAGGGATPGLTGWLLHD